MPSTVERGAPAPRELTADELARARERRPAGDPETVPPPPTPRVDPGEPAGRGAAPVLRPPGTPGSADAEPDPDTKELVTAQVLALHGGGGPGNTWVNLDGIGWRQLAGGTAAEATLGGLAAAARIQGTGVVVRLDAEDRISELYLW